MSEATLPLLAVPVTSGGHYAALDGWRGISISMVLLGHLFPLGPKVLDLNAAVAAMGMAIFFTLSGFLITSLLLRNQNIGNFLIRRLFRIVPLAWLVAGVCLLAYRADAPTWAAHFLFYGNLPPFWLLPVTAHLWSLCVEMQFYVGIALLVAAFGAKRLALLLPVLCVAVTCTRVALHEYASIVTWLRIDEILIGGTLALVVAGRLPAAFELPLRRVPAWVWLVGLYLSCEAAFGAVDYLRPYFAGALVGTTLLLPDRRLARWLNHRVLAYLALVSFALYVLHPPLADTWLGSGGTLERYAKRPLLLLALFGMAHLSTTQFESRCIALGRHLAERWTRPIGQGNERMSRDPTSLGKVAVLMGGTSAERQISLMSGTGVLAALRSAGADAHAFDPAERDLALLKGDGYARCFIALHGRHGEDGSVQGALELLGVPYTGSGVMASAIAMDKVMTKRLWRAEGLPTPRWLRLAAGERTRERLVGVPDELGLPLVVKPPREGSSIGITKVVGYSQMADAVALASRYDADVLCEEFIEGEEVTCPVLGEGPSARALPVIRILAPEGAYDYQNKYFTDVVKYQVPSGLPAAEEAEIQRLTVQAYRSLGCRGWGRADLMVRASDRQPFLLEMNTSPGMTTHSLVPMSARAIGLSYEALCVEIVAGATLDSAR